jgi:antitoxin MazE
MSSTRSKPRKKKKAGHALLRNSTLSRWGNSIGMRIPQEAVERFGLKAGERVEVEVSDESITIRPSRRRKRWNIADLVKGITPEKVGGEFDWGPDVGKERL